MSEVEELNNYDKLLKEIQACNCIKYAAYRTASKLLVLQKFLGFYKISLQIIRGVFEHHRIRTTDNCLELSPDEVENILYDIFYASSKKDGNYAVEPLIDITKLVLKQMLIKKRESQTISVLSLKILLVCLCSSSLYSKYQYWFSELMDHNLCLTRRRFHTLLKTLLVITDYLSESTNFSTALIEPTLESCFTEDHHSALGISEYDYMAWLTKEPQLLVWLSTFYRLSISEKVTHDVQCSVCGVIPIVGLRYHCLRCIRYDLCQLCFFTGRTSKHHKSKHVIREYCAQTSFYETTSAYLKGVLKRIWGSHEKLQYLPVNSNSTSKCEGQFITESMREEIRTSTEKTAPAEDLKIQSELRGILSDIEKESSRILNRGLESSVTHLVNYEANFLQECLNRIKLLQNEVNKKNSVTSSTQTPADDAQICNKSANYDSWPRSIEGSLFIPSPSRFSSWINETQHDNTYSNQLQQDLDNIMVKLNNMLESSSIHEGNSLTSVNSNC